MKNNRTQGYDWRAMQDKADTLLGDDFWTEINSVIPKRSPGIDMYSTEDEVIVVIEAPGLASTDQINIRLRGFKLSVFGTIPWTYPVTEQNMLQNERFIGDFKRELRLPSDIDPDGNVTARLKYGLIEIHIPKFPSRQEKDINVEFSE